MIKVSLVLLIGLAATLALGRRSAALRHLVLAAAVVGAGLAPLFGPIVPEWHLPAFFGASSRPAVPATLGDAAVGLSVVSDAAGTSIPPDASARLALSALGTLWAGGATMGLALLALGLCRLWWVSSGAMPVRHGRLAAVAAELAARFRLARPIRLLQSTHPTLLVTWGLRRPTVLLPEGAARWSEDRVRIVLGHELAHIRRGDWGVQVLAECLRCVYWFNPLAWIACRRLRQESERASDDAVLSLGVAAPEYASQLLTLARALRHGRRPLFPAPAMARPSDLERRVRAMLNARLDRAPVGRGSLVVVLGAMLLVTIPVAGLTTAVEPVAAPQTVASSSAVAAPAPASTASPTSRVHPTAGPSQSASEPVASSLPAPAAVAAPSRAQAVATASLVVTVTDQNGRVVPSLPVVLSYEATGDKHETSTDVDGRATFAGLSAGDYRMVASRPGFMSIRGRVSLRAGETQHLQPLLLLGELQEVIVVQGSQSQTRPTAATSSTGVPTVTYLTPSSLDDPCSRTAEGGCVTPPWKVVDARPLYPTALQDAGVSGAVTIEGVVRADGSVGDLRAASGDHAELAATALNAIRLWQFSPARLNGVPREIRLTVIVKFNL